MKIIYSILFLSLGFVIHMEAQKVKKCGRSNFGREEMCKTSTATSLQHANNQKRAWAEEMRKKLRVAPNLLKALYSCEACDGTGCKQDPKYHSVSSTTTPYKLDGDTFYTICIKIFFYAKCTKCVKSTNPSIPKLKKESELILENELEVIPNLDVLINTSFYGDLINIEFSEELNELTTYIITDAMGNIVYSERSNLNFSTSNELSIGQLKNGIYYLIIEGCTFRSTKAFAINK